MPLGHVGSTCVLGHGLARILPPFHITCYFDFSGYISFVMYISSYIVKRMYLRKAKTISNMKPREYSPYKLFVYSPYAQDGKTIIQHHLSSGSFIEIK